MKKGILWVIVILVIVFFEINLKYRIDMDVLILSDGSAVITEKWDVQSIGGRDWCKTVNSLGIDGYYISDYEVYMDGKKLKYVGDWFPNTIFGTKGLYGYKRRIIGNSDLCFTTDDMKRHTFILKYKLNNYIYDVDGQQVLYKKLIENNSFNMFNIMIRSDYYQFDNIEISGYGFDGKINVKDGKINVSGKGGNRFNYVSILGLLPDNSFNSASSISNYDTYSKFLEHAENDYGKYLKTQKIYNYCMLIIVILILLYLVGVLLKIILNEKIKIYNGYGYRDNKKINYDEIDMFRDIPFNKDIYYAYVLIKINRIGYEDCNILSAIILKWLNEKKIMINHNDDKVNYIDLTLNPKFEDDLEARLFNMMYEASVNGLLEVKEFYDWANRYDAKFLSVFSLFEDRVINSLKLEGHIYHRVTKKECRNRYIMDEMIYQDSLKLYGLRKFLEEFSKMNTKEVMDVKLWEEYMIFACLFGIADKVSTQLKHIHPDIEKIDELDLI